MAASAATPAMRRQSTSSAQTRDSILRATIEVIARHSLSGTTVERVAAVAGVAPGTVILHFKRKDALLVEALEHLAQEFDQARRAAIAVDDDPVGALDRLIDVAFDPRVSDPAKVAVWYAFWGEAAARSVYLERVGAIDHSYQVDLVGICQALIRRGGYAHIQAEPVALGFIGIIEYFWQEIMVAGPRFDRAHGRRTVHAYLANVFPRHFAVPA